MGQRFVPIEIQIHGVPKGVAEVKGLTNAFDQLEKTSSKSGSGLKNAFDNLGPSKADQTLSDLKNRFAGLHTDVAKLRTDLPQVSTEFASVGSSGASAFAAVLNPVTLLIVAIPILIGLMTKAASIVADGAKEFGNYGEQIHKVQQETHIQAETMSAYLLISKATGVNTNELTNAFSRLDSGIARGLGDPASAASKSLKTLNLDLTALKQQSADQQVNTVAAAIANLNSENQKSNVTLGLVGKSYKELGPAIEAIGKNAETATARAEKFHLLFDARKVDEAHRYQQATEDLDLAWQGLSITIGQRAAPEITAAFNRVNEALTSNSSEWTGLSTIVSTVIGGIRVDLAALAGSINQLPKGPGGAVVGAILEAARGATEEKDRIIAEADRRFNEDNARAKAYQQGRIKFDAEKGAEAIKRAQDLTDALKGRLENFGDKSLEAATKQKILSQSIKDLSPDVQQEIQSINAGNLALARRIDQMTAAAKASEEAKRAVNKHVAANENLRNEIDAVRLRTLQMGDAEGATRTELEKFNEALIKRKDRNLLDPEEIDRARLAYAGLDSVLEHIAQNKAFDKLEQDRQSVLNALQTIHENVAQAALQALPDDQRRVEEQHSVLMRTVRTIEGLSHLHIDRTQFAGIIDLFKAAPANINLESAVEKFRSILDPAVLANLSPLDIRKFVVDMFSAAEADRAWAASIQPVESATRSLKAELKSLQDEVPIAAETAALRYQIAWQDANNAVVLANDAAVVRVIKNQVYLAHQMDVDFNRLNDGVIDFLAEQKTLQQTFQDVRTNSVRAWFDGIESAIDKMTRRLGLAGNVLGTFLKDLAHLAASQFLQRLLGLGSAQTAGAGGSGFSLSNLIGGGGNQGQGAGAGGGITGFLRNLFGGGASSSSGPPAYAGAGARLQSTSDFERFFGGGITAPASLSGQAGSVAQIAGLAQGNVGGVFSGGGGGGLGGLLGGGGGIGAAVGPIAIAALLGSQLGGRSTTGKILGGIGGGAIAAALLFGSLGLGLIAAPLLVGAIILARNARRRADEKVRNKASLDTLPAVYEILFAAQRGELTISQARSQWDQVHNNYLQSIAGIKDGKTKRNAILWWDNDVTPIWKQIEAAAKAGERAKLVREHLVPEFASGGLVPYFGGRQTLIKVRSEERIDDVGLRASWIVPGFDTGRDSVYTFATPGSAVRTKEQQSRIPGFARGSDAPVPGGGGGGGDVVFEFADGASAALMQAVLKVNRSRDGRKLIIRTVRGAQSNGEL